MATCVLTFYIFQNKNIKSVFFKNASFFQKEWRSKYKFCDVREAKRIKLPFHPEKLELIFLRSLEFSIPKTCWIGTDRCRENIYLFIFCVNMHIIQQRIYTPDLIPSLLWKCCNSEDAWIKLKEALCLLMASLWFKDFSNCTAWASIL